LSVYSVIRQTYEIVVLPNRILTDVDYFIVGCYFTIQDVVVIKIDEMDQVLLLDRETIATVVSRQGS
jgi:hypothetical protein